MTDRILPRTDVNEGCKEMDKNTNVQDIRKKFEYMSSNENGGSGDSPKTPVPPERRLKNKPSYSNLASNGIASRSSCFEKVAPKVLSSSEPAAKRPISVKERTKIFESNTETNCDTPAVPKASNGVNQPNHFLRIGSERRNSKPDQLQVTPPVKPPRTFISNEKVKGKEEFKENFIAAKDTNLNKKASLATKKEPIKISEASTELSEACNKQEKDLKSKPQVPFSKKQAFCNKLKKLSGTALKKSSAVFVDLTPTTVSPPKHYGTLKKSHSEEHIYAEPYAGRKDASKPPARKESEPLHYMCTPLIKPEVPERRYESNVSNRKVVRNLIYNSFASLRCMPKEDSKISNLEPSESDVSMKAIQDRIIYVKSIRQVSGSSLCIAPKLYEALYIISVSEGQPEMSYSFPLKVPEEFKYPLLPHICFPDAKLYKATTVYQSEVFKITLLDKGEKILGYCLRIMGNSENKSVPSFVKFPVAICILSKFNAPLFYRKLLNEIEKHLTLPREQCFKYIRSLQKLGVPNAGASVSIPDYTECSETDRVVVSRPLDSHIVGFEMTRALQLLDVDILVKAVASLLLERRVLFFSSNTSNLYHCCKAISSLLYPFEWPHMFIPVLPPCLVVHCCSELPYILGLSSSNSNSVLELLAEHELLIIDIDKGAIVKACNDEDTILPRKIQKAVVTALNLAKNMTDPTEMLRDVMISEAFVHMFVEMIGHYENHFIEQNGEITFQKEGLLKNAFSYSVQTFLQWFSETCMFESFINESTWRTQYRTICQDHTRTFFEKRVDEYKWELTHNGEKISRFIEKTVRNIGERIMHKLKK